MIEQAVVLAGGFGTRLQKVVQDVPKPMALINGRPFLEYQLNYLKKYGIGHIVFSVGYKHEFISKHFGNQFNGMKIDYAVEKEPLGTGGGILNALQQIDNAAFVVNGDTLFDVNLKEFYRKHSTAKADISLALRKVKDIQRYGSVKVDGKGRITGFSEKGSSQGEGLINGGIYLIEKRFFEQNSFPQKFSMEKDCFEKYYKSHPFYGFAFDNYFLDIGIPEDYQKAQDEFQKLGY